VQDVRDDADIVLRQLLRVVDSFKRNIVFHNGISVEIPIEAEIGYDFQTTVRIKENTLSGVKTAIEKLKDKLAALEPQKVMVTV
jgi:hypothetical protein